MAEANVNSLPCVNNQWDTMIKARQIFQQRCLPEFVVARVEGHKCLANTPCCWMVYYKYKDANREYEGGEYGKHLVRRFDAAKPEGSHIMKPAIILQMSIDNCLCYGISYGTICECEYDEVSDFGSNDEDYGPFYISKFFPN